MAAVQPTPEATHIVLTSSDGYTANLTLGDFPLAGKNITTAPPTEGAFVSPTW